MEEKEIIKTDDPNIVIERTTTEREINVEDISNLKSSLLVDFSNNEEKISQLKSCKVPVLVKDLIEKEILELSMRNDIILAEIEKFDLILNSIK